MPTASTKPLGWPIRKPCNTVGKKAACTWRNIHSAGCFFVLMRPLFQRLGLHGKLRFLFAVVQTVLPPPNLQQQPQ